MMGQRVVVGKRLKRRKKRRRRRVLLQAVRTLLMTIYILFQIQQVRAMKSNETSVAYVCDWFLSMSKYHNVCNKVSVGEWKGGYLDT